MSIRAELVRLGLRWLVKRRIGPRTTVAQIRYAVGVVERWLPRPRSGTVISAVDAGSVRGEFVTVPASRGDRFVLFLHGGGYIACSPAFYRFFTWRIARSTAARVLAIDYRLAPEHPFPAAIDDAAAGYRWLLATGADPAHIAVMGDSAGSGLMFGLLLKLRDDGIPLPAVAVALSPWTDLAITGQSMRTNDDADPFLQARESGRLAGHYLAAADPREPYASPLYGDPAGLPPTLIQVGSDEILLDDARRMAERMRAAGCEATIEVWPRMPHVWQLFAMMTPEGRKAMKRIGAFVQSRI